MADFPLYEDIILLKDIPEEGLEAGDVGVVVACHDVPGLESGYSIEFFSMSGETVAVVTLPASVLRRPASTDRPMVRHAGVSSPYAFT